MVEERTTAFQHCMTLAAACVGLALGRRGVRDRSAAPVLVGRGQHCGALPARRELGTHRRAIPPAEASSCSHRRRSSRGWSSRKFSRLPMAMARRAPSGCPSPIAGRSMAASRYCEGDLNQAGRYETPGHDRRRIRRGIRRPAPLRSCLSQRGTLPLTRPELVRKHHGCRRGRASSAITARPRSAYSATIRKRCWARRGSTCCIRSDRAQASALLADVVGQPRHHRCGRVAPSGSRRLALRRDARHQPARRTRASQGIVLNSRDITERKALEDQLTHQAFHDSLTALANRALFHDRVEHALARVAPHGPAAGGAVPRSRQLQDRQRQPRACRGRSAACRNRRTSQQLRAHRRHRCAAGW